MTGEKIFSSQPVIKSPNHRLIFQTIKNETSILQEYYNNGDHIGYWFYSEGAGHKGLRGEGDGQGAAGIVHSRCYLQRGGMGRDCGPFERQVPVPCAHAGGLCGYQAHGGGALFRDIQERDKTLHSG